MTVRIPIQADAAGVTQQIDRIRDAIRRAGQESRAFRDLDLSHPELRQFADDLERIRQNIDHLATQARGGTAAAARRILESVGGRPFGPGSLFDSRQWQQQYVDPREASRRQWDALRYTVQGTSFAPAPPPIPLPMPGVPGGVPGQAPGFLPNIVNSAGGGAMSLLRGFLPAMAALAGVRAIGAMATEGVQQAGEEAMANDRLLRTLRDLDTGFMGLRDRLRQASDGLALTYVETQQLAASFAHASGETSAGGVVRGVRTAAGFARGYGLDPGAVTQGFGRAAFLGEDPRRFAVMLAEAIQSSGMTGRPMEVMETLLRFQETNARRFGAPNAIELFAGAYSTLSGSGNPGLRGGGAEAMLRAIDAAVTQGGGAGEAGRFVTWRAMSRHGVRDIFQQQYALEGGMFGGVNGGEAGPGNPTNFEAMFEEASRLYPGDNNRYRRWHAMGRYFGLNSRQMQALEQARGNGGFGAIRDVFQGAGINIGSVSADSLRDIAEVAAPGADLGAWRTRVLARQDLTAEQRRQLESASGDDLRNTLMRTLAGLGREQTDGSRFQEATANLTNALTHVGTGLLPVVASLKDVLADFTGVVGTLGETISDGVRALFGNPEALERLRSNVGGPLSGAPVMPGSLRPAPGAGTPQGDAARQAYNYYVSQGVPPHVAAGMVAQEHGESGFNHTLAHDGPIRGHGLMGWNGPRLARMGQRVAEWRGIQVPATAAEQQELARSATAEEQRRFAVWELNNTHRGAYERARQAQSASGAGAALTHDFTIPRRRATLAPQRGQRAQSWHDQFTAPSGTPAPETPPGAPGTPAPGGGAPLQDILNGVPGMMGQPERRSSLQLQPLRVIVEDTRGNLLSDQFLALEPPTRGGEPIPWGFA